MRKNGQMFKPCQRFLKNVMMKVTVGVLGTVLKILRKIPDGVEIRREIETIIKIGSNTRIRETKDTGYHIDFCEKRSDDAGEKISQGIIIIIIMQKSAPVLENRTHKLLWDFDIHTNHLISARRPDLIIINKKKKREFAKLSTLLSWLTTE